MVNRVKHLGCHFASPLAEADLTLPLAKFYGSFHNILNVLGHNRNELLAVHLAKSYCLPTLLYGCDIWSISVASINLCQSRGIMCSGKSLTPAGGKVLDHYSPIVVAFLVDQRKLLFWEKS